MGTVWVIQESIIPGSNGVPMDYSPAERFGDVQFALTVDMSRQSNSPINGCIFEDLSQMVGLYHEGRDYLVLTGSPAVIFMVGAAFALADKRPTLLVWDKRGQEYRELALPCAVIGCRAREAV